MARLNTALELHIDVLQGLQKVDAYEQDMFQPPEIDLQLNRHQDRLIDELFSKEFQDFQLRAEYVKTLIVKNYPLTVYVPSTTDSFYEPDMGYVVMPPDYLYLVNDRSLITTSAKQCEDLTSLKDTTPTSEYIAILKFPSSTLTSGPYYTGFVIQKTESAVTTNLYTLPSGFTNYITDKEAKFMVINNSLEYLNRTLNPTTKVYWERYRGTYYPNSYVFVRSDNNWSSINATTYTNSQTPTVDATELATFTQNIYFTPILTSDLTDQVTTYADNGMTEGDKLYDLRKNVYYQTSQKEPTSAMSDDLIHVYWDKSFIITKVLIDYVRKPRQISLLLDQSCELPSAAARADVVDRTIQYLKMLVENPTHREFLQDNIIKNQNSLTNG